MTDEDDTVDVRDAYDVGETFVRSKACVQVRDTPLSFLGDDDTDRDDWEPDYVTGYIKGVQGHYHVRLPTSFGAISGGDAHGLVALSVKEGIHGPASFTGLYVRSDAPNYLLTRYVDGDRRTAGETTDVSIGEFLNDRDVVWVDDDAIKGVEPPNTPDVDVGDRVDYYAGDTGDPDDAIVYDLRDEDDLYIDVLRPRDGELSKVSRVPPKTPHMDHGYMPADDDGEMTATDGGIEEVTVQDDFVRDFAVPEDDAVTYCHVGLDSTYHPAGGYWFPADVDRGKDEANGWVDADAVDDVLPDGEVVQYPRNDRLPRVMGSDTLPEWVKNRVVDDGGEGE